MLPFLEQESKIEQSVADYLGALKSQGFQGDIESSYASCITMATDNSIYQLLPQALLFPRTTQDVVLLCTLAQQKVFQSVRFVPRGGGTGTNGQALNDGVVIDFSRYMNRILDFNLEERWVKVEAGVIKDQLNKFLQPFDMFFAPELSTSNRATLGGMINTDASGQGSLVYGKTSNYIKALTSVLMSGTILKTQQIPMEEAENFAKQPTEIGKIYRNVLTSCRDHRQKILDKFPQINRFLTGYDLKNIFDDNLEHLDLSRILAGSEGTLAFITEATLSVTPIPKIRRMINIKYESFDDALTHAPQLLKASALSVETIDSTVLNLAREDIIWNSVKDLIRAVPEKVMLGLNLVEFAGDDAAEIEKRVEKLCEQLERQQDGVIGYQICESLNDIEKVYAMRKKAVGLLGNAKGWKKPIPFVEDTCVPPQHLASYIKEFRTLLDNHNLKYGMFGHVDAGVLHVRPALDIAIPEQAALIKQISDEVVALTAKYGGLLWGEHGKGFRAEYSPQFFGETLYLLLRGIKSAFDPKNRLNPGKICTPLDSDENVFRIDAVKRGNFDSTIPIAVRNAFKEPFSCNGNGLCFNFDVNSPMCPSMKVSNNRLHSPKGRAMLIREWLRLLAEQNVDVLQLEEQLSTPTRKPFSVKRIRQQGLQFLQKCANLRKPKEGKLDFSVSIKEAMNSCLACKACSTQCPIKIDVPMFRARFFQLYYTRYFRPIRDRIVANVETLIPLMGKIPQVCNFLLQNPLANALSQKIVGMVSLPALSYPTLKQQLTGHSSMGFSFDDIQEMSESERSKVIFIVQDIFTSYYDANMVVDCITLVKRLGFKPVLLPMQSNGKPQQIKGFLAKFDRTASKTARYLNKIADWNLPIVGLDPAMVICYRDEYSKILGARRGDFTVLLLQEWLFQQLTSLPIYEKTGDMEYYLLSHCTEKTVVAESIEQWQDIFAHWGVRLESLSVGCCGMAGTYGHEAENFANSAGIYATSWEVALDFEKERNYLVTGYSCRSQVKRFSGKRLQHPIQALLNFV